MGGNPLFIMTRLWYYKGVQILCVRPIMFNRIGRLAIASAVGVIIGAGAIFGISQIPESEESKRLEQRKGERHMIV